MEPFHALEPDPEAAGCDAFTQDWGKDQFYAFPPFAILAKVMQKVQVDRAFGIVIAPLWVTQPWYPVLLQLCTHEPVIVSGHRGIPKNPRTGEAHPMGKRLKLGAFLISGRR